MLKTNFDNFSNDLNEVINEFGISSETEICVFAEEVSDGGFSVRVVIDNGESGYTYSLEYSNALEKKRFQKRFLKLSLYKALCDFMHTSLPWGALTGIRPTKLAYQCISEGIDYFDYFTREMLVTDSKTELIEKIIEAQSGYYEKNDENCDFFVSVPFCPSRCEYCSFLSQEVGREKRLDEYVDALVKEIISAKNLIGKLRSVYVGGGTPVSIGNERFLKIMKAIDKISGTEYTVEAGRPDAINRENLEIMKDFGVTRVCVNPQTFCNETLRRMGRKHTAEDIFEKYALVKSFGFDVNMDLIAGLMGEDFGVFSDTLKKAIELKPENITVHTLSLKRGSVLKQSVDRLSGEEVVKMVDYAHFKLGEAGYRPYYLYRQKYMAGNLENTGYAVPGKECVYNIDIMEEIAQNVACGANAVSKRVINGENRIERYGAPKDIASYIGKVDEIMVKKAELYDVK